MMHPTVVINVVGLSLNLLKDQDLFINQWMANQKKTIIKPVLPAVTCTAQSTYLTGKYPNEHGIVGNGWYFKEECEVKFWKQANKLVKSPKIWDELKAKNPNFTCSNMFWWYNMYATSDFDVTPRPQYRADGQKKPDCYAKPASLRDRLQKELGTFPLFHFWGPKTTIKSSQWIANAAMLVHKWHNPTLQMVYLPHLDYVLQKTNDKATIYKDLKEIDEVLKQLITFYEAKGVKPIILSEYGINPVETPIHINRILRKHHFISIREENGLEILDAGASDAFAVADHQMAHVYAHNKNRLQALKTLLKKQPEIDLVLDKEAQKQYKINHQRSGDLVVVAKKEHWFTYYYWLDDQKAPDFARTVDIHKKPGYDPVEMFTDPNKKAMTLRLVWKLLKKKLGFRTLMNVIPLEASLVKGSHGAVDVPKDYYPVLLHKHLGDLGSEIEPTQVYELIKKSMLG